jgi:hypothetical protein
MENITDLLDFEVRYTEDGSIEILDICAYPQESKKCFDLHRHLDLHNIYNSGIEFPIHLKYWSINLTPDSEDVIKKYYSLDGIKKILDKNISILKDKITFFKPQITYPHKSKYPNLIIHFYQVVDEGEIHIIDELDLFENCVIEYEDTKMFTKKRIKDLEKLVSVTELQQIPFLPIEIILFNDDGTIKDIEQHILAKSASQNQDIDCTKTNLFRRILSCFYSK